MDVPPPTPPSRGVENDHGTHDLDDALDRQDGLLVNGLDNLLEVLVGYAAGGSTSGMDTGATVVNLVVSDWFNKLHPLLYRRLADLRRLELAPLRGGGGGVVAGGESVINDNNASGRIAQLERELKQALHMTELANKDHDYQTSRIAELTRQLDNSETLLEVAKNNLSVTRRDTAQEAKRLQHANKELFASVEKERAAKLVAQKRVDDLLLRLDVLNDLTGGGSVQTSSEPATTATSTSKSTSAQISQLKRDVEKANHRLELARAEMDEIKRDRDEAMDMRTMGEASAKGLQLEIARLKKEADRHERVEEDLRLEVHNNRAAYNVLGAAYNALKEQKAKTAAGTSSKFGSADRIRELESVVESMEQEIAQLEADKASLEVQLDEARKVEDRLVDLEAEKQSLSAQVEEVEEERDVLKDVLEESKSESEGHVDDLKMEIARLQNLLDDKQVGSQDEDEGLAEENKALKNLVGELERRLQGAGRQSLSDEGSEGATRGDSGRMANMARRLQEVENSARTLYETNQRLIRQRQEEADRLADLESENRALRYATPNLPTNVPGLVEENRRYREQIQELMRERQTTTGSTSPAAVPSTGMSEDERTELESLRQRNYDLQLELLRVKKTSKPDDELQREYEAIEKEVTKAEDELEKKIAEIERQVAARKAGMDTRAQTAGMTRDEHLEFNRAEARRNYDLDAVTEELRIQIVDDKERLRGLRSKATKLRNQVALRKKEFELQEEANKRTKRTEARIMLGARALMV